ncbi:phage major capsid protein [Micromonospora sp. WMMC415]|uniref:phage major capsid protein n=1 Tax=Micromonospora sp. WMMC415 TaxID=2675222 RepID=UPI0012B49FE6|nr:phage major capsid protein [Micromonospora sp. WMMC415]QGN50222.1 phage major capsid protein [Micromonospora sp. WMMC415]
MTDFIAAANAALEKRSRLFMDLQNVNADTSLTPAERQERAAKLNADLDALGAEAEQNIRAAEVEVENRELLNKAAKLSATGGEKRAAMEWRAMLPNRGEARALAVSTDGADLAPKVVSKKYIDVLIRESTFLKAFPNVIPFEGSEVVIPHLTATGGAVIVPELQSIPLADDSWSSKSIPAMKIATRRQASNEILADSQLPLRNIIAGNMIRDCAVAFDTQAFGSGNGTTAIKGLLATGQHTSYATVANIAALTYDHLLGMYADIIQTGGTPDVLVLSPGAAEALAAIKANTAGTWLGLPPELQNLRRFVTSAVPGAGAGVKGGVIMADSSRVFPSLRSQVNIATSTDVAFAEDAVQWRVTYRVGSQIAVAEATSVQTLTLTA